MLANPLHDVEELNKPCSEIVKRGGTYQNCADTEKNLRGNLHYICREEASEQLPSGHSDTLASAQSANAKEGKRKRITNSVIQGMLN